jgi:hypothetical protein
LAALIVLASYIIITLHSVVTKLEEIIVMSAGYIFLGFVGSWWTSPNFERYFSLAVSSGGACCNTRAFSFVVPHAKTGESPLAPTSDHCRRSPVVLSEVGRALSNSNSFQLGFRVD